VSSDMLGTVKCKHLRKREKHPFTDKQLQITEPKTIEQGPGDREIACAVSVLGCPASRQRAQVGAAGSGWGMPVSIEACALTILEVEGNKIPATVRRLYP
jgi:hypothetical protein